MKDTSTATTALTMGSTIVGNPSVMMMGSLQLQELNHVSYINTKAPLLDKTTSGLKYSHVSEIFGQPFKESAK